MDPSSPNIDYGQFQTNRELFKEIYRDTEELLPDMQPPPRGRTVNTTAFVDASHGANRKTRRSHTGFVLFVCRAPIIWYSKRQQKVESSAFSSKFIAMRACVLSIKALCYKLRMFGVPIEGATNVFSDNKSLTKNVLRVEATLNKKHSSIAYHLVRWAVPAGEVTVAWIKGTENKSDAFTKLLSENTRNYLFGNWTY